MTRNKNEWTLASMRQADHSEMVQRLSVVRQGGKRFDSQVLPFVEEK
jgi:hypothetical protein